MCSNQPNEYGVNGSKDRMTLRYIYRVSRHNINLPMCVILNTEIVYKSIQHSNISFSIIILYKYIVRTIVYLTIYYYLNGHSV